MPTVELIFEGGAQVATKTNSSTISFTDTLRGLGTAAYRVSFPAAAQERDANNDDDDDDNENDPNDPSEEDDEPIYNPSYEITANPAVPDGNYVGSGGDAAASFFADGRISVEGRQSLRLSTPSAGNGLTLAPYPLSSLTPNSTYTFSIWVRGRDGGEVLSFVFSESVLKPSEAGQPATFSVTATKTWAKASVKLVTTSACTSHCGSWLSYSLATAGVAWLDAMSLQKANTTTQIA